MFRVAVLDDYQANALELADWGQLDQSISVTCFADHVSDERQLVARLEPFDAVVAMRERTLFPKDLLEQLPSLRLIVTKGMANAAIDVPAARALGITVCGTQSWAGATGTIELAWGLIFALARDIPLHDAAVRHGGWQLGTGFQLSGKRFGLVGLGNLGPLMVPVAKALDMDVVAWSRNLAPGQAAAAGATAVDRETFFGTCDVVSVHIKLSERSHGYVGRDELRLMKPTAFLVNTSRGPVVDEAALVEALTEHWIAGAGLDVFDVEPLPREHPLRHLPRTVLTPHLGYVTEESYRDHYVQTVEDLAAFVAGRPVRVLTE